MRKISILVPVYLVLAMLWMSGPVLAEDCAVHRFAELGKKAATITLVPTERGQEASGLAQVKLTKAGRSLAINVRNLPDPIGIRPEYLTYVAWLVPERGPIVSLGELRAIKGKARLLTNVDAESFGLIVTAEPHFATSQPSNSVVLQSVVDDKLAERLSTAQIPCSLAAGDRYAFGRRDLDLAIQLKPGPQISAELLQARNARKIAELAGAERLAKQPFAEASQKLVEAEQVQARKPGNKGVTAPAIASVVAAEQAYLAALAGQKLESEAAERKAQQARDKAKQEEEQRAAREAEEARDKVRRETEMRTMQERQQQLERDIKTEADRRTALEKEIEARRIAAAVAPRASSAPLDASSDLHAERERLEAERAKLQAERVQAQADLRVERARIEADSATLRAQIAVENAERDREENKIARAEIDTARRAAEQARVEAERSRSEAETAAERARLEVERTRLEEEVKAHEADRQRVAKQAAAPAAPAVTPQEVEAARQVELERTRLVAELQTMQQTVEQERARATAEQKASASQQELERTKLEAERSVLQTEIDKLAAQLEAERVARENATQKQELDRGAEERRREEARAAIEAERLKQQSELQRQQSELAAAREAQTKRESELAAARDAQAKQESELTAAREAQAKREAEVAAERAQMQKDLEAERAAMRLAAEKAERERGEQSVKERTDRRGRLLTQLAEVLEAKDTERGLVINMSDVTFAPGRFDLNSGPREKLARVAGILLAYPGLKLELEGHTDSTGSVDGNKHLSEKRAGAVRDYFVSQGVAAEAMVARGYGASRPVASNETAEGRATNRRIECVISGAEIGTTK